MIVEEGRLSTHDLVQGLVNKYQVENLTDKISAQDTTYKERTEYMLNRKLESGSRICLSAFRWQGNILD